jgi:hypothetical protein
LLSLLTLPETIRQAIKAGKIPVSSGYELAKIGDPARQAELAQRMAEGKITRNDVAGSRKPARRQANGKRETVSKRATAILGNGRAVTVCTSGDTLDDFIAVLEQALVKARHGRKQGFTLDTLLRLLRDQAV